MEEPGDWASLLPELLILVAARLLGIDVLDYFYGEELYPVVMYSVSSGTCELLSTLSIIHDYRKRIRPSVRPFTLADQLLTFCNHRSWSRGLMFHEYHCIPTSWKHLLKKFKTQDREVQVPG